MAVTVSETLIKTRHKGSIEETAVVTKIPFLQARAVLVTPGQPVGLGRDAQVGARPSPALGTAGGLCCPAS